MSLSACGPACGYCGACSGASDADGRAEQPATCARCGIACYGGAYSGPDGVFCSFACKRLAYADAQRRTNNEQFYERR